MLLLRPTELRAPGEAETRLEAQVINRRNVFRSPALTSESERRNLDCRRHIVWNRRGRWRCQPCRDGAALRIGERDGLRQIGTENALQIMLLGARLWEGIAYPEIDGQVLARLPIVLHEGRQSIPAVIVIEQERSNVHCVRDTQQKAGEVVPAVWQARPTVVTG